MISFALQLFLFYNESMKEKDIRFDSMGWTEVCAGKIYTITDKNEFCNNCYHNTSFKCEFPVDMNIYVDKVRGVVSTGGEVHCFFIIDGINYLTENGRYFGLTNDSLFTWQVLRADTNHTIELCCGIDRSSALTTILGLEKDMQQACISRQIDKRCGDEYLFSNDSQVK